MCWKELKPRFKVMLISSFVPLILYFAMVLGAYNYLELLMRGLIFSPYLVSDGMVSTISYWSVSFWEILFNLLIFAIVYAFIGFFSGWLYEIGFKTSKNRILALILAVLPWILLIIVFSMIFVTF